MFEAGVLAFAMVTAAADEPATYGPFFEKEPVSQTQHPAPGLWGKASRGPFCVIEGPKCHISLVWSVDAAMGISGRGGNLGPDLPYAQAGMRVGATFRPWVLMGDDWHPWSIGPVFSWSRGAPVAVVTDASAPLQTGSTDAVRVAVMNQIWLSQRKHAAHLDITVGGTRSDVLADRRDPFSTWGTHAEVAVGFGGWGGVYVAGDFLDRDTRIVSGFRTHGLVGAPIVALILGGLLAGGAL